MSTRYCGRNFSRDDLDRIKQLIDEDKTRTRAELSRLTCQQLNWFKADGGLKDMSCRVSMLRMEADGLITLPTPRRKPTHPQTIVFTSQTAPRNDIILSVDRLSPPRIYPLKTLDDSRLWNEYIHRYHYLGHKPLPGAQLRYFVTMAGTMNDVSVIFH